MTAEFKFDCWITANQTAWQEDRSQKTEVMGAIMAISCEQKTGNWRISLQEMKAQSSTCIWQKLIKVLAHTLAQSHHSNTHTHTLILPYCTIFAQYNQTHCKHSVILELSQMYACPSMYAVHTTYTAFVSWLDHTRESNDKRQMLVAILNVWYIRIIHIGEGLQWDCLGLWYTGQVVNDCMQVLWSGGTASYISCEYLRKCRGVGRRSGVGEGSRGGDLVYGKWDYAEAQLQVWRENVYLAIL